MSDGRKMGHPPCDRCGATGVPVVNRETFLFCADRAACDARRALDCDLPPVWGVLVQSARTGRWSVLSIFLSEGEAVAACDRETLRVVALRLEPAEEVRRG